MQRLSISVVSVLVICGGFAGQSALADIVDQEQTGGYWVNDLQHYSPVGQSFIPVLDRLDWVELKFTDNAMEANGSIAYVNIREDSITGPIIGTSGEVFLDDCFNFPEGPGCGVVLGNPQVVRFDFDEQVQLEAGSTFVIEVLQAGDRLGFALTPSDNYANGNAIFNGVAYEGDLFFREGIYIPEPSGMLLLGLTVTAAHCLRLSRGERLHA